MKRCRLGRRFYQAIITSWFFPMRHFFSFTFAVVMFGVGAAAFAAAEEPVREAVRFNRDIRPILWTNCLSCHGPDAASREAELRLDDEEDVRADRGGYRVLTPGEPEKSELLRRITSSDPAERMPPAETGKQLSLEEIEMLRRWVAQGGQYEAHWSFIPPTRPVTPLATATEKRSLWPRNAIDDFVLAGLKRKGFQPSPRADRATLLRRASLDVTGLPPTLDELDAFLSDPRPDAFDRAVARLFASPHYGEQRARYWLDAARFADTNGFFTDDERSMWRWRDWVIDAFNRNLPFDRFTIEQLAGDLLPGATTDQKLATGFNRNHMVTHETGVIDEEYRIEYVVDRVNTTATVWLALSVGCARCHDHKFDPFTQKEFYELFAFFNTVEEKGNAGHGGNTAPLLEVPSAEFLAETELLKQQAEKAQQQLKQVEAELNATQTRWAKVAVKDVPAIPTDGLLVHHSLDDDRSLEDEKSASASLRAVGAVEFTTGMLGGAARLDGGSVLESSNDFALDRDDSFSYGAWIYSERSGPVCVLSKNDDVNFMRGFDLMLRKGKAVIHLVHKWNSNAIQLMTKASLATRRWQHVMVTYDGSSSAAGVRFYVNGQPQELEIRHDRLSGSIRTDQPLRIGRRSTSAPFTGMIDDVRVYGRELTADEVRQLAHGQLVQGTLGIPLDKRTKQQRDMLRQHFLAWHAPDHLREIHETAVQTRKQAQQRRSGAPTTMVMQEMKQPRKTFLLNRGQYDAPSETVAANTPHTLPPLSAFAAPNRLGLAQWLVDPGHPLTARVTVNRIWRQYFGTGIVRTLEDFGAQGDWPSHPELLDWLAVEFIESGWDMKHIQRLIVTSATYRQASAVKGTGAFSRDPTNRWLGRGPRQRLDAEAIRDNALAISGLLTKRLGGRSVKPYQPPGLWEAVSYDGSVSYEQETGAALYRRGLYTFWKRQSPPPSMLAFDAPTRETCTVRRARTNTPLQALVLMNDPTYVEAARALAQRVLLVNRISPKTSTTPTAHDIATVFRMATARPPQSDELAILLDVFQAQLSHYQRKPQAAIALLQVGESPRDTALDPAQHAALTTVASMILNLDETISKR